MQRLCFLSYKYGIEEHNDEILAESVYLADAKNNICIENTAELVWNSTVASILYV